VGYAWEWMWRRSNSLFGDITIILFVLVQCLDGTFTYVGVNVWGVGIEANPLISCVMSVMGVGLGLATAKLVAIGLGLYFYWYGLHNLVALLTTIYVIIAILPWTRLF